MANMVGLLNNEVSSLVVYEGLKLRALQEKKEIQNPSMQPSNVFFAWAYVGAT